MSEEPEKALWRLVEVVRNTLIKEGDGKKLSVLRRRDLKLLRSHERRLRSLRQLLATLLARQVWISGTVDQYYRDFFRDGRKGPYCFKPHFFGKDGFLPDGMDSFCQEHRYLCHHVFCGNLVPTHDSTCVSCGTKILLDQRLSLVEHDILGDECDGVDEDEDERLGEWWSNRMEALLVYPD